LSLSIAILAYRLFLWTGGEAEAWAAQREKKLKDSFPGFFLFFAYFPLALKPPAQEQNFISCREKVVSINILFFIKFWGI
jgi:hypothetical protein